MGRVVMASKDVPDVEMVDWYFNEQGFEILSQSSYKKSGVQRA